MKIKKITDAFVNEFDGQTQSCSDDCKEYRGKAKADIQQQIDSGVRSYWGYSQSDQKKVNEAGFLYYCYLDKTPKTSIYL